MKEHIETIHCGTEIVALISVKVGRNLIPQEPFRLKVQELTLEAFQQVYQVIEKRMEEVQTAVDAQIAAAVPVEEAMQSQVKSRSTGREREMALQTVSEFAKDGENP